MAALLIGIGSVSAKKRKEVKNDLVGVWQQVSVTPYAKGQYRPILKIVSFPKRRADRVTYRGG